MNYASGVTFEGYWNEDLFDGKGKLLDKYG